MPRLEEQIRAVAYRSGFQLCGFVRATTPPHAAFVRQWVADGNVAGMAYIERGLAKRLQPALVLSEIRTIITLGQRYLPPPVPPLDWREQMRGRIAAYAYAADYHQTIERKLRALAAHIQNLRPDVVLRSYVDTGAVLEREWGAAAGIGWFGKNTNLLHTREGSYYFLAELLTNLDLEPDASIADHCGTCTRCLDLCPTEALKPGYTLDARLCISYLTIEHRGIIPAALRSKMGNWIFGCDVCQEVCPWNAKLVRRDGVPESESLLPFLPDLLRQNDQQFRDRFRGTAIVRAKRDGFIRNVAVALGNTRNPAAVRPLGNTLRCDPSSLVRLHAAWALGAIGDSAAVRALESALISETSGEVRNEIAAALSRSFL